MNEAPPSHRSVPEHEHSFIDIPKADQIDDTPFFAVRKDSSNKKAFWIFSWFMLNTGLALLMKFIFDSSAFKFPVLISTIHMLICTVLSLLTMRSRNIPKEKLRSEGNLRLQYLVFLFCLNIAFGNIAVMIVSLPLSQMVRSTIPIFIMILSTIMLRTRNTCSLAITVLPIVIGVAMTAYGDIELTATSLIILVIGNIFAAMKVVVTNKYLVKDEIHPMVMLAKLSPLATLVMLSFAVINGEIVKFAQVWNEIGASTYFWVLTSGGISFFLNWTNFLASKSTSPLTMSVLGNLKQVVLVFISIVFFGTQITVVSLFGITIATIGLTAYSFVKCKEK